MPPKLVNKEIALSAIRVSPKHWGRAITNKDVEELADNISKIGQLHQIAVRPAGKSKQMFELLSGQRRYEALRKLGRKTARCLVVTAGDDLAGFLSISEGLCQKPMTGAEIASAAKKMEEYYTRLFMKADMAQEARDKEDRSERAKNIMKGPPKGARTPKVKPKAKAKETVAKDLGVSPRTVERATRRAENLTASVARAYQQKLVSDAQADILAGMEPAQQRAQLPQMIEETAADTKTRLAAEKKAQQRAPSAPQEPTEMMVVLLEGIIKASAELGKQTKACLAFSDSKDIDYGELPSVEQLEECAHLLEELIALIEQ